MKTILLPNGYSGDVVECYPAPLEWDNGLLRLAVVDSGYLFRWVRFSEWVQLTHDACAGHEILTQDGAIMVQSCDENAANVGITRGIHTSYRRVSVPDLIQQEPVRYIPWEMRDEEFARIVQKYATEIKALIVKLNTIPL